MILLTVFVWNFHEFSTFSHEAIEQPYDFYAVTILRQKPGRKRRSVTFDGERTFNNLLDLFEMKKNMHQFQFVGQPKSTPKNISAKRMYFQMKTATFAHIFDVGWFMSRPPVGMEFKILPYRRCQEITQSRTAWLEVML